ncbi:MAG TPA: FHA domain-containing protein [Gemmataceae bacterium]|jgi:pSer/pThr/pTyr-binding forkhead associated (FHA) protein|nr:FHA domain-containing protein [Gemmataceae bacterium]
MKVSLVVLTPGKSEGKIIPITLSQFLIGRDPQCHLRPASASISKRHCAILIRDNKVFVRDFDSTNGTFVNDRQIKGEIELRPDDRLKIGPLLFAIRIEAGAAASKETPPPATRATPPPPTKAPVPEAGKPSTEPVDDEAVAALLLSVDEGGPSSGAGAPEIPEGSTVLDRLPIGEEKKEGEAQPAAKKPANPMEGDTSSAARAILQKYMRRPRT